MISSPSLTLRKPLLKLKNASFGKWQLSILVFFALFELLVDVHPQRWISLIGEQWADERWFDLFSYILIYIFSLCCLYFAFWLRSPIYRAIIIVGWAPLIWTNLNFRFITGYEFMYSDASLAVNHFHMMSAAMSNFNLPIILSALATITVISIILFTVQSNQFRFPSKYVYAMPFAFALITWQISRSGGVVCQFPSFFRIPVCMGVALSDNIYPSHRDNVLLTPLNSNVQKLIFIIDESITGSKLSLNGNTVNSTPFLSANSDHLINFGIAQSFTNYSAGSNALLMTGIHIENLPDLNKTILKSPTIFQYAKKAGYETFYIDAQMAGPGLQNYMSPNDLPYIDHFIRIADSLPQKRYFERDMAILDWLQKISKSSHKTFVVTNKAGAHWPYGRTFPKDSAIFKPFIQKDKFTKDRNITLNSYYNSIRWSVDTFWKRLIKNSSPKDSALIVYTSDHGQDLSGTGNQISHASVVDTKRSEVDVPLWLYDRSHYIPRNFKPQKSRYSHEQIFPSLLIWMGYNPVEVKSTYGQSLLDTIQEKPQFWVGDLFGRGISKKMIVP